MEKKVIAICAGSFDPITKGHLDIIRRASKISDKLIVGVSNNYQKNYWFTLKEREELVGEAIEGLENVEVLSFEGLLVDFVMQQKGNLIVRGLRAVSDYEYELQLALTNRSLSDQGVETIFLPGSRENLYLSASLVREVAIHGGKLDEFIPESIMEKVKERGRKKAKERGLI